MAGRINPVFCFALSAFPDDSIVFPICFYVGIWVDFFNSFETLVHSGFGFINLEVCIVSLFFCTVSFRLMCS